MREGDRPNHGPDISPSSRENLPLREALERRFSSANFPPLNPQTEGPTERDIHLSNAEIQTLETRLAALLSRNQKKEGIGRDLLLIGGTSLATTGLVLGGQFLINKVFAAENENADSFRNTFNPADGPKLVDTRQVNPEERFDPNAMEGVISEKNTIRMTREEYQKIAPPVIDRENRKEVPGEFNLPPDTAKATGNKTRKLTLEQGTSINTMTYVKTPEGKVRDTTYTKISNPGEVTGRYPFPMTVPNCSIYLGQKGEIQAGDVFPAPITGRVYRSSTITDYNGSTSDDYRIVGEYYDEKGKKFMVVAEINTIGVTKPLIENISNQDDEAFKEKVKGIDSSGKEVEVSSFNANKMPVVTVQEGQDLFKFITKPLVDRIGPHSSIKSQVKAGTAYHGIDENDKINLWGGENCVHPTVDTKAVVLIQ